MTLLDEAVAAAGVDPRELLRMLTAAQPERTLALARAFEDAGQSARAAHRRGQRAHATVAAGFGNNGAPVLDAGSADRQAFQLLGRGGQDMEDTAGFLKRSVVALDAAQSTGTSAVHRMVADVNALAARWNAQLAATPAAGPADRARLVAEAAGVVRTAGTAVQRAIDDYDRVLLRDAGELGARGYAGPATGPGGGGFPGATYAGGPPLYGLPTTPDGADPYRGLSPVNGVLTAGDVAGGLYGAKLESSAHYQRAYGKFLADGATPEIARLRAQETVLNRAQFYRDLDFHQGRLNQGSALIRNADDLGRSSRVVPPKIGGALALAGIGYDIATGKDPVQAVASGGGGFLASVAAGAATGAVVGTFVPIPGVGTAVGAAVGAGVGVFTSGAIDSLFENGPDVGAAVSRGAESVADTGKAIGHGVVSVAKGIGGLFD